MSIERLLTSEWLKDKTRGEQIECIRNFCLYLTHTSTAIEGNSLTIGDTRELLSNKVYGLKDARLNDQIEVLGHEKAVKYLLHNLYNEVTEDFIFELHKFIQVDDSIDIYAKKGQWKESENGTRHSDSDGKMIYVEYTKSYHVKELMGELINYLNSFDTNNISSDNAHIVYAKVHIAISQIHPFYDGNGRMSRLVSNILLLRAGVRPIIIPNEFRKEYIKILYVYGSLSGQVTPITGIWPNPGLLKEFEEFCLDCSKATINMIDAIT